MARGHLYLARRQWKLGLYVIETNVAQNTVLGSSDSQNGDMKVICLFTPAKGSRNIVE